MNDTVISGRRRLKYKVKGDIDDGRMRSIAFVVNGAEHINVYFGMPRK